jgi:hypothetical protein
LLISCGVLAFVCTPSKAAAQAIHVIESAFIQLTFAPQGGASRHRLPNAVRRLRLACQHLCCRVEGRTLHALPAWSDRGEAQPHREAIRGRPFLTPDLAIPSLRRCFDSVSGLPPLPPT